VIVIGLFNFRHYLHCNGHCPCECGLVGAFSFVFLCIRAFGDKCQWFLWSNELPITQTALSEHFLKLKALTQTIGLALSFSYVTKLLMEGHYSICAAWATSNRLIRH